MSRIESEFGKERETGVFSVKPKYYIFSEGEKTERKYFKNLNKSILSKNVEIINILRDYAKSGNSNPSDIINLIDELLVVDDDEITIKELKSKLRNWGHECNRDIQNILNTITSSYKDKKVFKYKELKKIVFELFSGEIYSDLSKNFMKYLLWQNCTFSPITDKICLVVDRDNKSFSKEQYNEVTNFRRKNNIDFYVSNPCFEFWLYLHFREVEKENPIDLLKNKYVTSDKRYIEDKLHELCGYTKTKINFALFESNIKKAIKREKDYEENIIGLENKLGTNVGKLVNEIINIK